MKAFLWLFAALILISGAVIGAEKQTHKVTVTVAFDAKTLAELADLEDQIGKLLPGAKIAIDFASNCSETPSDGSGLYIDTFHSDAILN
jgi:hypothetical protein